MTILCTKLAFDLFKQCPLIWVPKVVIVLRFDCIFYQGEQRRKKVVSSCPVLYYVLVQVQKKNFSILILLNKIVIAFHFKSCAFLQAERESPYNNNINFFCSF
jgi:hypothetical protein